MVSQLLHIQKPHSQLSYRIIVALRGMTITPIIRSEIDRLRMNKFEICSKVNRLKKMKKRIYCYFILTVRSLFSLIIAMITHELPNVANKEKKAISRPEKSFLQKNEKSFIFLLVAIDVYH